MKKLLIVGGGFIGVVLVLFISMFVYIRGVQVKAMTLKEQYMATEKEIQTSHDNMWKTIKEKFSLSEAYKDGFVQSINAIVAGRTGGGLVKVVQENMPGLSPDIYKEVMATVEGKRDMLKRSMDTSVDVARQYNTFVQGGIIPHSWIVDSTRIDPKVITSANTDKAWESGQDNDTLIPAKGKQ
jgi:hypothetical protein